MPVIFHVNVASGYSITASLYATVAPLHDALPYYLCHCSYILVFDHTVTLLLVKPVHLQTTRKISLSRTTKTKPHTHCQTLSVCSWCFNVL